MILQIEQVSSYIAQQLQAEVQVLQLRRLGSSSGGQLASAFILGEAEAAQATEGESLKTFSYGSPILVDCLVDGLYKRFVLRTIAPGSFDHQRRSDRASEILLNYDTYNSLSQHAKALDVGIITRDHRLVSIADGDEFFLLSEYISGKPYASDLQRLRDTGDVTGVDLMRARQLAIYLVNIHANKGDDATLYTRRIRDVLYGGEGIMGLVDSYVRANERSSPPANGRAESTQPNDKELSKSRTERKRNLVCGPEATPRNGTQAIAEEQLLGSHAWFEKLEQCCVTWRWRLHDKSHRITQVHGDFHPFNVLFEHNNGTFHTVGCSRGAWGEPADDVACMAINYLFFSLQRSGTLTSPFEQLWNIFWNTYLGSRQDPELLLVIGPFFAWRALVLASPVWYNVSDTVRTKLLHFAEHALRNDLFDPADVKAYLREK